MEEIYDDFLEYAFEKVGRDRATGFLPEKATKPVHRTGRISDYQETGPHRTLRMTPFKYTPHSVAKRRYNAAVERNIDRAANRRAAGKGAIAASLAAVGGYAAKKGYEKYKARKEEKKKQLRKAGDAGYGNPLHEALEATDHWFN